MVGIVVVSHSCKVAEGICEIAQEMINEGQRIVPAGGIDTQKLGTDACKISNAITKANTGDGVVVLVDLGSALISAKLAIELLDKETDVIIADAPVLEGAIVAVIQASLGSDIYSVAAAAEASGSMKKL